MSKPDWEALKAEVYRSDRWAELEALADQLTAKVREVFPGFPGFYPATGALIGDQFNLYVCCGALTAQEVQELLDNSTEKGV